MDNITHDWITVLCEASNIHRQEIERLNKELEDLRIEMYDLRKVVKKDGKRRKKKDCSCCNKAGNCLKQGVDRKED